MPGVALSVGDPLGPSVPRVSVVVPLYNKAGTVTRALHSVREQSFQDFEVIVVDDGSTDDGGEAVGRINDPRFRLIVQDNAGPGRARNRAALEARGDYLAFLDADDAWHPGYLEKVVAWLDENPDVSWHVMGYEDSLTGRSAEKMWRQRGLNTGRVRLDEATPPRYVVDLLRFILTPATVIRRLDFSRAGGFYDRNPACFGEDTFLWLKLLFTGRVLAIDLRPGFTFHREDSGLSRNRPGPRPVEPFLTDPEPILSDCTQELRGLLDEVLRARAYKTACVLGFWGDWRAARDLRRKYPLMRGWRSPLLVPALTAGTPLGPLVGAAWRRIAGIPSARAS